MPKSTEWLFWTAWAHELRRYDSTLSYNLGFSETLHSTANHLKHRNGFHFQIYPGPSPQFGTNMYILLYYHILIYIGDFPANHFWLHWRVWVRKHLNAIVHDFCICHFSIAVTSLRWEGDPRCRKRRLIVTCSMQLVIIYGCITVCERK